MPPGGGNGFARATAAGTSTRRPPHLLATPGRLCIGLDVGAGGGSGPAGGLRLDAGGGRGPRRPGRPPTSALRLRAHRRSPRARRHRRANLRPRPGPLRPRLGRSPAGTPRPAKDPGPSDRRGSRWRRPGRSRNRQSERRSGFRGGSPRVQITIRSPATATSRAGLERPTPSARPRGGLHQPEHPSDLLRGHRRTAAAARWRAGTWSVLSHRRCSCR